MGKQRTIQRVSAWVDRIVGGLILAVATLLSVLGYFGQGIEFAPRLAMTALGALLYVVGARLYRRGKKASAISASELLAADVRPPVLYLRSFKDDPVGASVPDAPLASAFALTATEEEQIAEVFGEIGPVVAIGRPGERLPELGAARLYVSHDQWQEKVSELMARARLVVYRASDTQGFHWEVRHGGKLLRPEKMVFLIPRESNYRAFCDAAEQLLPTKFPAAPAGKLRCGSLSGLVYFDAGWQSHFVAPQTIWFRNRIRKPLISLLKVMAEPVFRQVGAPWSPPPIRWGLYAACLAVFVLPIAVALMIALIR